MSIKNNISYLKRVAKLAVSRRFESQLYFLEKKRLNKIIGENEKIVLIYTIGKVGSSSVYASLKDDGNKVNFPVFHVHSLNPERIEGQKKYYKSSERKSVPFHLIQSAALIEALRTYSGKIYVYSLIREPISRELSSLFQDSFNFTSSKNLIKSGMINVVNNKIEDLLYSLPEEEWFNNELKEVFGFDIYSMDFQPDIGYKIKEKGQVRLAFLRLENLAGSFSEISRQLFEEDLQVKLIDSNVSEDKFYNRDYKEIRKEVSISEIELDKFIQSRFIQKFYPDHQQTIKERWGESN